MKTRVIIEYDLPPGDSVALRDREEQRWTTSETVLALPNSAMVKVEVLDGPLMPAVAPLSRWALPPRLADDASSVSPEGWE